MSNGNAGMAKTINKPMAIINKPIQRITNPMANNPINVLNKKEILFLIFFCKDKKFIPDGKINTYEREWGFSTCLGLISQKPKYPLELMF